MTVLEWIIGGGIGLLIGFAVLIGQSQAQDLAWRRIAHERRELDAWERELIDAAESHDCAACTLRRGSRRHVPEPR